MTRQTPPTDLELVIARVLAAIDADELVRLTQDLIRIPSVYRPGVPDGNERAVAMFLDDLLTRAGLEVERQEVAPGRPNVWATLRGAAPGKTLLFEGHTDVVTEGELSDWQYPPFEARVADGRIYGRGACDTKQNLAAAVVAVLAIKRAATPLAGRLILCHPVDEEGLMLGIKHFIRSGRAAGVDAAVICEPEENQLCVAQKGALRVAVRFHGRMAHGAMPLAGVNPISRAARFLVAIEQLERGEIERLGRDPYLGYPSFTPTIVLAPPEGEPQINVVPSSAYVALDIRTLPGQDHAETIGRLQGILDRLRAEDRLFDAEMTVLDDRPWTETPLDSPIVVALREAYRRVTGAEPRYNGVPGATDGTFLQSWAGIPVVTTGAGKRTVPHQCDEWVAIDELLTTCRLYAVTALLFCGLAPAPAT